MKKQNGITLIALIITIIVMLILVAVTISVALNGGLFERGRTASEKTQQEALREQAEVAKTNLYANHVQNETEVAYDKNTVAAAIAEEVGGTVSGNIVTVVTTKGTYYVVVADNTNITITDIEPTVTVDNLIPTDDELTAAEHSGDSWYFSTGASIGYHHQNVGGKYADSTSIYINGTDYTRCGTQAAADIINAMGAEIPGWIDIEAYKWYNTTGGGCIPYDGGCPFSAADLLTVYSQTYVNRVMASFEN